MTISRVVRVFPMNQVLITSIKISWFSRFGYIFIFFVTIFTRFDEYYD